LTQFAVSFCVFIIAFDIGSNLKNRLPQETAYWTNSLADFSTLVFNTV
jgi:hypothetical protein